MKLCLQCNSHFEDVLEYCPGDESPLTDVGSDQLLGGLIGGRYKILCQAGRGSMGLVYKAIQLSTGREMAVKFLQNFREPNSETVKRFQREARTLSSLKHPNIITLFDFGLMENGQPYIVTEFLTGVTLSQLLRDRGRLPPPKAAALFEQVLEAVAEAHRQNIVHRDLKPDNIFLQGKDQGGRFAKVVDFGIAKLLSDTDGSGPLTLAGKVCGSPGYMSPEQCKGLDLDSRTDIYSLGVVMFETMTAQRPFQAEDAMSIMFMQVHDRIPRLASKVTDVAFTPALEAVVRKALSKDPADRQQSVEELWDEFAVAVYGKTPKSSVSRTDSWIPFPAGQRSNLERQSEVEARVNGSYHGVLPKASSTCNASYYAEFNRKKREFWQRVSIVGVLLLSVFFLFSPTQKTQVAIETADLLAKHDRPEDAAWLLERLQGKEDLVGNNLEALNGAYLQAAGKFIKQNRYPEAVNMLQHISARSKYNAQRGSMLRRCRRKTSS